MTISDDHDSSQGLSEAEALQKAQRRRKRKQIAALGGSEDSATRLAYRAVVAPKSRHWRVAQRIAKGGNVYLAGQV